MMKAYLMAAFCGDSIEDGYDGIPLPLIYSMPCTAAANAGINDPSLEDILRKSLPPNKIDVVQEMGRADCGQNPVGEYKYEVFLSFDDVMNLLLRIFQTSVKYVRDLELIEFYDVLQLMVLPTRCCHVVMEKWFEKPLCPNDIESSALPCVSKCSFCRWEHLDITKKFDRTALIDILLCSIFGVGKVTLSDFKKGLTENLEVIYGVDKDYIKTVTPSHIHRLALQLVAAQLVEPFVADESLVGDSKLNKKNIYLRLKVAESQTRYRLRDDALWEQLGFNCN
jgi:hypothetical protein